MPGWSSLRAPTLNGARFFLNNIRRSQNVHTSAPKMGGGGHAETMVIKPSQYQWNRIKDELHFYILLGVLPLAAFATYCNVVYGPAELQDIPEDYVPMPHEYLKNPVSRKLVAFFNDWLMESYEKRYEKTVYTVWRDMEKQNQRLDFWKMQRLMGERQDQKNFYFIPDRSNMSERYTREMYDHIQKIKKSD
ncbi:hypothetical protein DPMN_159221 [Dreissena polymorpha]|uniref:NADH dehydrogenase [ubiquinone] 1 beta subcomplex subunit 5, mitochondrial n=2 Tax=Dreissena polymorpha TaxID=45954 RepID=A0A9D4EL61_DREPO|nr:hypothetical protein DPMN_159221 [Dreissena polymorpha]